MANHRNNFLTPWQEHCQRWEKGCGSEECPGAKNIVLAKGIIPCDVCFVGEAPGESEDVLGYPFAGPAGKLLDHVVEIATAPWQMEGTTGWGYNQIRMAFTNLVGCIPREKPYLTDFDGEEASKKGGGKATEPLPEQIQACQPRLLHLIEIANPRLIVNVGALARDWMSQDFRKGKDNLKLPEFIPQVDITHPAAVLRASVVHKGMLIQKMKVVLRTAIEEYVL